MVVVSAVAFGVGALCLYYGARDLRTRRAVRRLETERDARGDSGERVEASTGRQELSPERPGTAIDRPSGRGTAAGHVDAPGDPRDDVAIERGFVLLALGGLCLLFGVLAL